MIPSLTTTETAAPPWESEAEKGYAGWLKGHNTENIAYLRAFFARGSVKSALAERLGGGTDVLPVLTGSDGRGEKGPRSKTGVVLLVRNNRPAMTIQEGRAALADLLPEDIFEETEVKSATGEDLLYFRTTPDARHPWPERLLGATPLEDGQKGLLHATQLLMSEAFIPKSAKILDEHRRRLRDSANVSATGTVTFKKEQTTHIDLQNGIAHFDPERHITSFKQGPIRMTQHFVTHRILRLLRDTSCPEHVLMQQPQGTALRLEYLAGQGVLPKEDAREAGCIYLYFLQQYHTSQWVYEVLGEKTSSFDKIAAKEQSEALLRLLAV